MHLVTSLPCYPVTFISCTEVLSFRENKGGSLLVRILLRDIESFFGLARFLSMLTQICSLCYHGTNKPSYHVSENENYLFDFPEGR